MHCKFSFAYDPLQVHLDEALRGRRCSGSMWTWRLVGAMTVLWVTWWWLRMPNTSRAELSKSLQRLKKEVLELYAEMAFVIAMVKPQVARKHMKTI